MGKNKAASKRESGGDNRRGTIFPPEMWLPLESAKPYPKNPRVISEAAIAKVAAVIREFGATQPIVKDENGEILIGHTRRLAALREGYAEFPQVTLPGLSEARKRALRIADNRVGEEAEWDLPLLGEEIAALRAEGFDLPVLGFDLPELRALEATEPGKDAEATPEPPKNPVTRPGDLWELGDHYLLCGDSTKAEDVNGLLDGVKPVLMPTDPPYGVEYDANWRNEADRANGKPYGARAVGKVENDSRVDWSAAWALFSGPVAYIWHADRHAAEVQASLERTGFVMRSQIIWAKSVFVIGHGDYHWQHEPCWYAVRKGAKGNWRGGRKQSTLWNIDHRKSETGHSTQKPVECMKRPIENNSAPGDAIYEPFCGSGTTVIAAEMTGRRCYAIEISPVYCDVIVRRWEEFTGKKAKLVESGENFEQTAKKRKVKTK